MGRALGKFGKWVVGPVAAALVGYFLLGPRFAGKVPLPQAVQESVEKIAPGIAPRPAPEESAPLQDESPASPQISVAVKPVEERAVAAKPEEEPRPRRRRRRRRAPPSEEAAPEASPAPDRTEPDPASTP